MLFRKDMYDSDWESTGSSAQTSEDYLKIAVELGQDQFSQEDWADLIEYTRAYVTPALASDKPTALQQTLLSLVACSMANLRIGDGNWCRASDWLLTALHRCRPENDPAMDSPLAHKYLRCCAAMESGERVLAFEPTQLHVLLDQKAFHNLALAYTRLSGFDRQRLDDAVGSVVNLRNRILDDLWKDPVVAKGRRRGETDIAELWYQQTVGYLNDISAKSQQIVEQSSVGKLLRDKAITMVQALASGEKFLLSDEQKCAESVRELLGRELTLVIQTQGSSDLVARRDNFERFTARATGVIAQLKQSGLFARIICLPVAQHVRDLVLREEGFAETSLAPTVVIKQTKKRYPIDHIGEMIRLQIEIVNQGKGTAEHCQVWLELPREAGFSFVKPMPLALDPIAPGRSQNLECPVRIDSKMDVVSLPVHITYSDVFANEFHMEDKLVLERQTQEPDWDSLMSLRPYGIEPISSLDRLRGRAKYLDTLKVNAAVGISTVLWGQKRVGKTSIAQVFEREVLDREKFLPVYVRRGEIAGYSEGQIARTIAARIIEAVPSLKLEVQDEAWFGPHLTRLSDWIIKAKQAGLAQAIVVIFDEFDEINPALYLGQRGTNFFATLRSLSELKVVWVFVGSERMPNIYMRHHATLNQVEVHSVDRVTDPRDIEDMIVNPVRGMLEWDPEAVDMVRQLTAGNPYYINLICTRVLKEMYSSRRTFVDRADVTVAAKSIVSEKIPTHWGHFWEDNAEIDSNERNKRAARSALFLAAFGIVAAEKGGSSAINLSAISAATKSLLADEANDKILSNLRETGVALVQRGVLQEISIDDDVRYQVIVPLLGDFLSQNGRTVVFPFYHHHKSLVQEKIQAETVVPVIQEHRLEPLPIEDEELISISEGLIYQGTLIDAMRIRAWLRQFPDEAAILLAAKLLRRLKEQYYFDLGHKRHAIDDSFKWVADQVRSANVKFIYVGGQSDREASVRSGKSIASMVYSEKVGRIVNIHIAYLGPAAKSGADIAREFKNQKRFARSAAIDTALTWVMEDNTLPRESKFVLLVDDFVASGNQARNDLFHLLNRVRKNTELKKWAEMGRILFTPLWGFVDGVDAIRRDLGDLVRIQPARNLGDEDRAFSASCDLYSSSDERRYAEEVFRHIGQQLQADNPLGWGNCQALVVFEDTVPNNTLPVFWSAGTVDEKPWRPLFMRP